jgi:hypothetical protein
MALMRTSTPDVRDYENKLHTLGMINAETQVRPPAIMVIVGLVLWTLDADRLLATDGDVACGLSKPLAAASDQRVEDGDRARSRPIP